MNEQIMWGVPTSLRGGKEPTLSFPINALPPLLREMTLGISETTSTDVAMSGTAILSAISYCFTGVYRMSAKRDHTEPFLINAFYLIGISSQHYLTLPTRKREGKIMTTQRKNEIIDNIMNLLIQLTNDEPVTQKINYGIFRK